MKVWWVLCWDQYYPTSDNFVTSFLTEEEAQTYVEGRKKIDDEEGNNYLRYRIINISDRLQVNV